ncbi:Uncharacterised protein [Comamonas testosteroni]|uniref:Uncharacterized protein n=1 Tax=Comamonas testosteroni TaxID=285 RepID=A0A8B4S2S0_COMTE|nr:hypothetical protein CTATCC11996_12335 [Comamonas testosteroni ATCC 11996]SUY76121.1 Uncharacterised protein [Comamonas testosteroni]
MHTQRISSDMTALQQACTSIRPGRPRTGTGA